MFNSVTQTPESFAERPPESSLPHVWLGFVFATAFLIGEVVLVVLEAGEGETTIILGVISLIGWIYWLMCVHRFHKVLQELSLDQHSITPGEAVWKHFIPFYTFVWIFRWPTAISEYLNSRARVNIASGKLIGFLLLLGFVINRFVDGALGLAAFFAVGLYISAKLNRHVEAIKGIGPDMLPPPPDQRLFGYVPDQPNEKAPAP